MSFQITVKSCVPLGNVKASNLYCTIRIGDSALKTGVYKGKSHTAVWNHSFNVNCKQSFMKVELWQDGFFQDTILADYMLNLSKYYNTPGIKHCQVITLAKPSKNVGQMTLQIQYNREQVLQEAQPAQRDVSKQKPTKKAVKQIEELKKQVTPTEYAKQTPKEYAKEPAKEAVKEPAKEEKPPKSIENLYDKPVPFAGTIVGVGSLGPNYAPNQNIPYGQKVPPSFKNETPVMNVTVPPGYREARQAEPSPDIKQKKKTQVAQQNPQKTMKVAQSPKVPNKQSQQKIAQQNAHQLQQQQLQQKYQAQQHLQQQHQLQQQQMQQMQMQQMMQYQQMQQMQPQYMMGVPLPPMELNLGNLGLLLGGNGMPHIPGLSFIGPSMDYGGWSQGWF